MSATIDEKLVRVRLVIFDFDGVFTDNGVWIDEEGRESVRCSRSDGLGLKKLAALGIPAAILSSEVNPVVRMRARKLGLRCESGHEDKTEALGILISEFGCAPADVAYVGNDINDVACLTAVGIPIVVADAHPDVVPFAAWTTTMRGGHGAVREVCDRIAATHAREAAR